MKDIKKTATTCEENLTSATGGTSTDTENSRRGQIPGVRKAENDSCCENIGTIRSTDACSSVGCKQRNGNTEDSGALNYTIGGAGATLTDCSSEMGVIKRKASLTSEAEADLCASTEVPWQPKQE